MKKWLWLCCWYCGVWQLSAQTHISLSEALERAQSQPVQLQVQRLYLQQQEVLKDAAKGHPAGGFGYGFEELGAAGSGVHSLYFNQSFNLPQVAQSRAKVQTALVAAGNSQLATIALQLERVVAKQYQQIVFFKNQQLLNQQLLEVYDSIVFVAQKRAAVGETSQLPLLSTQTAQQQLFLKQLQNQQQVNSSIVRLQLLLYDSTFTDISDSILQLPLIETQAIINPNHPLVAQIQQKKQVLEYQKVALKSQWLPQLDVGVQLQVVEGTFPNVAGQIGWSVPLFKQGLNSQIKGNEIAQKQLLVQAESVAQQIKLQQKNARLQMQALQQQIRYLETEILPTLMAQQNLLRRSYQLGEINYLNVLQSLEQILITRQQHLELLFQLNLQFIDYQYYSH